MIEVSLEQSLNARLPILFTELGIAIDVRSEHPSNALPLIYVTEFGITVFLHPKSNVLVSVSIMALQSFLLSYFIFPSSTFIEVRAGQELKALAPIKVTELGIVIEVRFERPSNAHAPISVTELGIIVLLLPTINRLFFVSMIALQLFLLSYLAFPCSTFIELRF